MTSGLLVYVESGTANGNQVFMLVTPDPITLGSTVLSFQAIALPTSVFVRKTVAGTTYTHILSDSGKKLAATNAGTKTITIAPQASVSSAVNTTIKVINEGAGLLTLAPGAGVTLNSLGGVLTVPQGHEIQLQKRANPNTWDVTGIPMSAAVASVLDDATVDAMRATIGAAATTQTDFISGIIASPMDQDYRIVLNIPYAITITELTTRSASGTCTLTGKINTTALGGTANSVTSSEQSQSHGSANVASVGDDIVLTISSNAATVDLSFLIKFTRVLV